MTPKSVATVKTCLKVLSLLGGLGVFGFGIWFMVTGQDCLKFLQWPMIIVGALLIAVSAVGITMHKCNSPQFEYAFIAFFVLVAAAILTLLAFAILAFAVSGNNVPYLKINSARTWLLHKLEYSIGPNWQTRKCFKVEEKCQKFKKTHTTAASLNTTKVKPVENACCRPPQQCGFIYNETATSWSLKPLNMTALPDCKNFNNARLCYDCTTCKQGVLAEIRKSWRTAAIYNICLLGLLGAAFVAAIQQEGLLCDGTSPEPYPNPNPSTTYGQ